MENKKKAVIALAGGIALIFVLAAMPTSGASCKELIPYRRYYFDYTGPKKLLVDALGAEVWAVIYYVEIWDPLTAEWVSPAEPLSYYIETDVKCAIRVQSPVTLCNFIYWGEEQEM